MFILIALVVICFITAIEAIDAGRHGRGVNRFGAFLMMMSFVVLTAVLLFDERMWR